MKFFKKPKQIKYKAGKVFSKFFPLFLALWILLVLYPNPLDLIISIKRGINPEIDPAAVETRLELEELPSDPADIETAVLQMIPYSHDWAVYGEPWYVPTVEEALDKGRGDCKARALVLASILEAKGIPYRLNWSPIHVWVDYEGKQQTSLENPDVKFYEQDPETGDRSFQFPHIPLSEVWDSFWDGFWAPMPIMRMILLILGSLLLITVRLVWFKRSKWR